MSTITLDDDSIRSPYEIFGVPVGIHYVELRRIYRDMIHQHKEGKLTANEFRSKVRAYETLSDFEKREKYDSTQEWIESLPVTKYTTQQLAAEPSLALELEYRLKTATLSQINAQDPVTGHTALYCAARAGNVQGVKFLTTYGAEPDLSQRTLSTALHAASFFGHPDVVRYLLETGADYRIKNSGKSTAEDEAYTESVRAVFTEMKAVAYVRAAANDMDWFSKHTLEEHIDEQYYMQRQTLLHCASKKGYLELVRLLVEKFSANMNILDVNFNTALHLAAYGGHDRIVEYLLNRGCDPTSRNRWGTTAEEEGAKHGEKILGHFKCIRDRDKFEMARQGVLWWFQYYMDQSRCNSIDSQGVNLLYYACSHDHRELVRWLLIHGADIDSQMKKPPHSTPLHVAKYRGHSLIVELLLEYGADVTIKNDFGFTVFEEVFVDDLDESSKKKIKEILSRHQKRLESSTLIDIHLYSNKDGSDDPIHKFELSDTATYKDLIMALPEELKQDLHQFSIARRPLKFQDDETTLLAAIRATRYIESWFIETPICLTMHQKQDTEFSTNVLAHPQPHVCLRTMQRNIIQDRVLTQWSLSASASDAYELTIRELKLTLPKGSVKKNTTLDVYTYFSADLSVLGVQRCICAFEITAGKQAKCISEMPFVSITNNPDAELYTFADCSPYLFRSKMRRNRLGMFHRIHIFVSPIHVIPKLLSLPPDTALVASLDQLLTERSKPVRCLALQIQTDTNDPLSERAYHGTCVDVVQSIIMDGFATPGTVVSSGKRIKIPFYHIARDRKVFGHNDFAGAIFLSPSVHYSSDSTYARPFTYKDQLLLPVFECSVKKNSYSRNPCTVPGYNRHEGDDLDAIEWRVENPANIVITALLLISQVSSLDSSIRERQAKAAT